jgi:hypothetical protein
MAIPIVGIRLVKVDHGAPRIQPRLAAERDFHHASEKGRECKLDRSGDCS